MSFYLKTFLYLMIVILFWIIIEPWSPLNYDRRIAAIRENHSYIFFQSKLFKDTAEIASKTGFLLAKHDNKATNQYGRLEEASLGGYDCMDGFFWGLLGLFTDIRPDPPTLYKRNILFYLGSALVFSLLLSLKYKRPALLPFLFLPASLSIYLPQIQRLIIGEYIGLGIAPSMVIIIVIFFLFAKWAMIRFTFLNISFLVVISFFLSFLGTIHSSNFGIQVICFGMLFGIMIKDLPQFKKTILIFFIFLIGNLLFSGTIAALKEIRDTKLSFKKIPRPNMSQQGVMISLFNGIGVFPNSLGIYYDQINYDPTVVFKAAGKLGVTLANSDFLGHTQIVSERSYFRLWTAYVLNHPYEYFKNRIQANAWILARFAKRYYPDLSQSEKIAWQFMAVVSWIMLLLLIVRFYRSDIDLEIPVVFLSGYISLLVLGIIAHPVRGYSSIIPLLFAFITYVSLKLTQAVLIKQEKW